MSKRQSRQAQRVAARAAEVARLQAEHRRRNITIGSVSAAVVVVLAIVVYLFLSRSTSNAKSVSSIDNTASTPVNLQVNPPIDNIRCDVGEQTTYHVHAHLSLYINGQAVSLPANIGIAADGSCFYWLHTHDTTGVIHMEAPGQQTFTLGTFFKLWAREVPPLQSPPFQLDQSSGWQVYVDGKPYTGDFRNIELSAHTLVTMAYNTTGYQPDTTFNWNGQ